MYKTGFSASKAIKEFQKKRVGSLKQKGQKTTLLKFEECKNNIFLNLLDIEKKRKIFYGAGETSILSYDDVLKNQNQIYSIIENEHITIRKVPIIINKVLDRLQELVQSGKVTVEDTLIGFFQPSHQIYSKPWNIFHEENLEDAKNAINGGYWDLSNYNDPRLLAQLLLDFLENLSESPLSINHLLTLKHIVDKKKKQRPVLNLGDQENSFMTPRNSVKPRSLQKEQEEMKKKFEVRGVTRTLLLLRFKEFLTFIINKNSTLVEETAIFLGRIAIALVHLKPKVAENFKGRDIVYFSFLHEKKEIVDFVHIFTAWLSEDEVEAEFTKEITAGNTPIPRLSKKISKLINGVFMEKFRYRKSIKGVNLGFGSALKQPNYQFESAVKNYYMSPGNNLNMQSSIDNMDKSISAFDEVKLTSSKRKSKFLQSINRLIGSSMKRLKKRISFDTPDVQRRPHIQNFDENTNEQTISIQEDYEMKELDGGKSIQVKQKRSIVISDGIREFEDITTNKKVVSKYKGENSEKNNLKKNNFVDIEKELKESLEKEEELGGYDDGLEGDQNDRSFSKTKNSPYQKNMSFINESTDNLILTKRDEQ